MTVLSQKARFKRPLNITYKDRVHLSLQDQVGRAGMRCGRHWLHATGSGVRCYFVQRQHNPVHQPWHHRRTNLQRWVKLCVN